MVPRLTMLCLGLLFVVPASRAQTSLFWPADACGPQAVRFKVTKGTAGDVPLAPEPGQARVYLFALDDDGHVPLVGHPVLRLGVDGQWVGATHGASFVAPSVAPGMHRLCAALQKDEEDVNFLSLNSVEVLPGKTYFFSARVNYGTRSDTEEYVTLMPIPEIEARFLLRSLPESHSTPR